MERFYEFAGVCYRVCAPEDAMYEKDGILEPFRVDMRSDWDHELILQIVDALPETAGELAFSSSAVRIYRMGDVWIRLDGSLEQTLAGGQMCIVRHGCCSRIYLKRQPTWHKITPKVVLDSMEADHQVVKRGGFLLHASYIRYNNQAILFTAPSGTGKSTQADLWCRLRGAELINGDRAAVMALDDGIVAQGVPFSGSSGVAKNETLPLKAIVCLAQAPVTKLERLRGFRAFRALWEGCSVNVWDRDMVDACTDNVIKAIAAVPVFYLACTPDESAVFALENALVQEE